MFLLNFFYTILAQAPQSTFQLPPGNPVTYGSVSAGLDLTAKFLYTAGITLGVITLVVSGIMYFIAGSDIKAEKAKGWFRNGVIGAFVILATGVIIKTIDIIVKGRFFP